jgi:hypothetical protein
LTCFSRDLGEVPRAFRENLVTAQAEFGRLFAELRPALSRSAVTRRRIDEEEDSANRG